jgi:hypothetical protein
MGMNAEVEPFYDRFWRIVLKKSVAQLFGMLQGIKRA